jgi:hypothetical protein
VEIFAFFGSPNTQIDIFGPGDILLGSTSITTSSNGVFFGVISDSPITRITFTAFSDLFTNLSFGECTLSNIPTLSEWGLIIMAGVLGIVALLVIRRRKATA